LPSKGRLVILGGGFGGVRPHCELRRRQMLGGEGPTEGCGGCCSDHGQRPPNPDHPLRGRAFGEALSEEAVPAKPYPRGRGDSSSTALSGGRRTVTLRVSTRRDEGGEQKFRPGRNALFSKRELLRGHIGPRAKKQPVLPRKSFRQVGPLRRHEGAYGDSGRPVEKKVHLAPGRPGSRPSHRSRADGPESYSAQPPSGGGSHCLPGRSRVGGGGVRGGGEGDALARADGARKLQRKLRF